MYLLGYSLNNLSLMALTIATGFVVDDAIVMIENISRHLEMARTPSRAGRRPTSRRRTTRKRRPPPTCGPKTLSGAEAESLPKGKQRCVIEAALAGASEIGFTIISLTVSLIAVLIPLLFMSDVVGRLFREFAVTLAITIIISAVVSLTLVPMMSARWLQAARRRRDDRARHRRALARASSSGVMQRYDRALDWVHRPRAR